MSQEWNAAEYARLSDPQYRWGRKLVDELQLRGDEVVLDAGCGAGRVTADLLARLPHGRVVALDLSGNMVAKAHDALTPRFGERVGFVQADLQALPLKPVFDGVLSTATFHWVPDHEKLFRSVFASLKPGGWLVAQCGGGPNLLRLRQRSQVVMQSARFESFFRGFQAPQHYEDPDPTAALMQRIGFIDVKAWLEEAPVILPDEATFRAFEANVTMHRHLERIPDPALREEFLDALTSSYRQDTPPYTLDYWRLNLRARKPS